MISYLSYSPFSTCHFSFTKLDSVLHRENEYHTPGKKNKISSKNAKFSDDLLKESSGRLRRYVCGNSL